MAAEQFLGILEKNVKEGGYSSKRVFNVDETSLFLEEHVYENVHLQGRVNGPRVQGGKGSSDSDVEWQH